MILWKKYFGNCILEKTESKNGKKEDNIGRLLVAEFKDNETRLFDDIMEVFRKYPDFQKFLEKQKSGLVTVNEACKSMGISKSQWYNLSRKIDRRPRSKGSGDLNENTPEAC